MKEVEEVGHISVGIILSAFCLPLTLFQVQGTILVTVEVSITVDGAEHKDKSECS